MNLLDFNNQEKGFKKFELSKDNIKANIGKRICYVDFVEKYRGTYFVRYGTIYGLKRNYIVLEADGSKLVEIKKIKECGIEI